MNTMETICSRKSVRSYTGENITADELNVILKAATASPVGMGQYDSLHLTVITNVELLNKIDAAGAALFGYASFIWRSDTRSGFFQKTSSDDGECGILQRGNCRPQYGFGGNRSWRRRMLYLGSDCCAVWFGGTAERIKAS